MKIRALAQRDREKLYSMLVETQVFTGEEIEVAMELIDIVLKDPNQEDYRIDCVANEEDQAIGYVCYGPVPMTQGTFDLYWISLDPRSPGQGGGSNLLPFLDGGVR